MLYSKYSLMLLYSKYSLMLLYRKYSLMIHIWSDKAFKGNRCNCKVGMNAIFARRITWNYVFSPFKLLFINVQRIHDVLLHSSKVFMGEFCHNTTLPSVVVSVVVFIRTVVVLNNIFSREKLLRLQVKYKSIFNRTDLVC